MIKYINQCIRESVILLQRVSEGQIVGETNSQCNVQTANGFSLSWTADSSGTVLFQYSQTNFPTSANTYWTGVAFGESYPNQIDAIIIEVFNGQTVTISSGFLINDRLEKSYSNIVATLSTSLYAGRVQATFSRPIFNDGRSLDSCNTWRLYSQPTLVHNTGSSSSNYVYSGSPELKSVCSIMTYCQPATYGTSVNTANSLASNPSVYTSAAYATSTPTSIGYTTQLYSTQTPYISNAYTLSNSYTAQPSSVYYTTTPQTGSSYGYSTQLLQNNNMPTSSSVNIYGYNYDSNTATGTTLIQNSNYDFLDDATLQRYLQNTQYQYGTGLNVGNLALSDSVSAIVLTDEQQNQVNYQQILADYQRNPSAYSTSSSSANIYGYDYGTSSTNYYSPSSPSSSMYNTGAEALAGYSSTISPYSSFYIGSSTYSPVLYSSQTSQNPTSSVLSTNQRYYQPSALDSLSLFTTTQDPYNVPRAESYLTQYFDPAVNGAPYYPYRTSMQVIEPNSGSYYQATLHNKK
uniref:DOMON domain-containing protein n=1 Tax=Syphacia muris TaxID=451379 RepID=A0A0N5AYZ0_9BILA